MRGKWWLLLAFQGRVVQVLIYLARTEGQSIDCRRWWCRDFCSLLFWVFRLEVLYI